MVRVIEGEFMWKCSEGKQKLLRVSGRFESSRVRVACEQSLVRVTEGNITVNV